MVHISVTPTNLTQGPGIIWFAPYGTAAPADSAVTAPPSSAWTDVGGTQGGIMLEVDNTYTPQNVDQLVDDIGARLTKRAITITTQLAETTLQNLNLAANYAVSLSPLANYSTLDLQTATSATQPTYSTLIIDGWAPVTGTSEPSCRRRIIAWKVLSQTKVTLEYDMTKNAVYNCTWTSFFVSASVSPIHIVDQTS